MEVLLDVDRGGKKEVDSRQDGRGHGPMKKTYGIEPTDLKGSTHSCSNHSDEDYVLQSVKLLVPIRLDTLTLLCTSLAYKPTGEMVQNSVGTNPVAEDSSEKQGRQNQ